MTHELRVLLAVTVIGFVSVSCRSESSDSSPSQESAEQPTPTGSASAQKQDKLSRAVASAIATDKSNPGRSSGKDDSAPPTDGVIEIAKADAQEPTHSPPKLTLGATGSEPRVMLGHRALGSALRAKLQVSIDLGGGQGLPPVDFKLDLKPAATKVDAQGVQLVNARIGKVSMDVANVPDDFRAQLRKVEGSRIAYKIGANGGAFDFVQDTSKSKTQELGDLLDMVVQGLEEASLAMPSEPVGLGAYWMILSRRKMLGLDWLVYDMVKVAQVTDKDATLEVTSRRYVVGRDIQTPPGVQSPKLSVKEASASGTAKATALRSVGILSQYERTQSVRLALDAADNSGQRMMQAGGQLKFALSQ